MDIAPVDSQRLQRSLIRAAPSIVSSGLACCVLDHSLEQADSISRTRSIDPKERECAITCERANHVILVKGCCSAIDDAKRTIQPLAEISRRGRQGTHVMNMRARDRRVPAQHSHTRLLAETKLGAHVSHRYSPPPTASPCTAASSRPGAREPLRHALLGLARSLVSLCLATQCHLLADTNKSRPPRLSPPSIHLSPRALVTFSSSRLEPHLRLPVS